jgi:hypothetical protein
MNKNPTLYEVISMKKLLFSLMASVLLVPGVYAIDDNHDTEQITSQEVYQQKNDEHVDKFAAITRGIFRTMALGGVFSVGIVNSALERSFFPVIVAFFPSIMIDFGVDFFDKIFSVNKETREYSNKVMIKPLSLLMLSLAGITACTILAQDCITQP